MIDVYSMRARSLPVYITIMPVILVMAAALPQGFQLPLAGAAAVVFVPLSFLTSQLGADFGKRLERNLWKKWNGPPTSRFFRHDNDEFNPITRQRIHQKLSRFSFRIPSPKEQQHDPGLADIHWQACAEFLISRTRDKRRYPLVFKGLVEYGFRRNLLGLKPFGLPISVCCLAACARETWNAWSSQEMAAIPIATALLTLAILVTWIAWVTEKTVFFSANRYARFLLESTSEVN